MKPKISLIKIFLFTIGVSITTSKDICLVGGLFFLFLFFVTFVDVRRLVSEASKKNFLCILVLPTYSEVWVGQVVVSQKGCFEKNSSAWTEHPPHPILKRKSMKNLFYPYNLFGEFRSWNSQFVGKKKMRKWKMGKNETKDLPNQQINCIIEIFVLFPFKKYSMLGVLG